MKLEKKMCGELIRKCLCQPLLGKLFPTTLGMAMTTFLLQAPPEEDRDHVNHQKKMWPKIKLQQARAHLGQVGDKGVDQIKTHVTGKRNNGQRKALDQKHQQTGLSSTLAEH